MFKQLKKLLIRAVIYIAVILSLFYLFLVWQAKQGVDAFIVSYPLGGNLEYEWILVDLDGNISLFNASFFQQSREPLFQVDVLKIESSGLFDLLDLRERIIYRNFSDKIIVNFNQATSSQTDRLANLFGVVYEPNMLSYLYPKQCAQTVDRNLPPIKFNLSTRFTIQQTADINFVEFNFDSKEIAQIEGSFKINNFTSDSAERGFVSDLSIQVHDLTWIQQNTQKCLSIIDVDKSGFINLFKPQIQKLAKKKQLILSDYAADLIADFVYIPQTIGIDFKIKEGKTFQQIPFIPMDEYQDQTGLNIKLNLKSLDQLFKKHIDPSEKPKQTDNLTASGVAQISEKRVHISINSSSLTPYLGAKLLFKLKNKIEMIGYLEKVGNKGIQLRQLKYKGESVLPLAFNEIDSILFLRIN